MSRDRCQEAGNQVSSSSAFVLQLVQRAGFRVNVVPYAQVHGLVQTAAAVRIEVTDLYDAAGRGKRLTAGDGDVAHADAGGSVQEFQRH